jgi:hypothetical protein
MERELSHEQDFLLGMLRFAHHRLQIVRVKRIADHDQPASSRERQH